MTEVNARNFGHLIAFVIPGFVVVSTIGQYSPTVSVWLGESPTTAPTVAGFGYIALASIAVGVIVSALRWLVIDTIHHRTGVAEPSWDFATFHQKRPAFESLADNHYRFHQFYANLLVAFVLSAITVGVMQLQQPVRIAIASLSALLLLVILFLASRDALQKYYRRTEHLLNSSK